MAEEADTQQSVEWQIQELGEDVWTTVSPQLSEHLEKNFQEKKQFCNYAIERGGNKHFYRLHFDGFFQQNMQTGFARKARRCVNGKPQNSESESESEKLEKLKEATAWKVLSKDELTAEDSCSICLDHFNEESDDPDANIVHLSKCKGHYFHDKCLVNCYKNHCLECPMCKTHYGIKVGVMPFGVMKDKVLHDKIVPGHEVPAIEVSYLFPQGIQGPENQHPGTPYSGTVRVCYLPDNDEGREVLRKLKIAFARRLTFTIGTSVTSGRDNTVVWNGLHHKTNITGGPSNFGYPDETYLTRVTEELASVGVV